MPLRYVSRRAEEQIAKVADKLGFEPLPTAGPVEELLPEDLLPEYSEVGLPPPSWATPEMLAEKYQELERLMEEARAFLDRAREGLA